MTHLYNEYFWQLVKERCVKCFKSVQRACHDYDLNLTLNIFFYCWKVSSEAVENKDQLSICFTKYKKIKKTFLNIRYVALSLTKMPNIWAEPQTDKH